MWIRSQDRKKLLKCDNLYIIRTYIQVDSELRFYTKQKNVH